MGALFYRPADSVAADFIPYFHQDRFHLFFLRDYRDSARHGEGTPWWHLTTQEFLHYQDLGEALPRGEREEQDRWVFTGCVIQNPDGRFQIFYTGHNGHFVATGKPCQAVMRADSPDLRTWTKIPEATFYAPGALHPSGAEWAYEKDDWRDPFVFWNEEAGEYWMLLAARKDRGPKRNRGCLALCASPDLERWEVRPPFWAPDLYFTHECPDLFRMGDWWYLLYSTFSERHVTHYRMARSLSGPWLIPDAPDGGDTLDGRAYYAAKSAADTSGRRYLFGWLPTRVEEKDTTDWQWGGELVVHEILQQPDGTLTVRPPQAVVEACAAPLPLGLTPLLGDWRAEGDTLRVDATARAAMALLGEMPETCRIETELHLSPRTANAGLLLRADAAGDSYYQVRLEPSNGRVVTDRWPRPGDQPFMLERPVSLPAGAPITLRVFADGTNLVIYVNDRVALSSRMYEHGSGALGLFVNEGEATFTGTRCWGR